MVDALASRSDSRRCVLPASPSAVFGALSDPHRVARWWGPDGFTSTIHRFEFVEGGPWLLTMHGPDGTDYPNESRFTRIVPDRLWEIEHLGSHHFLLTLELTPVAGGTELHWCQAFDSAAHYQPIASFVAQANQQNLVRLAADLASHQVLQAASPATRPVADAVHGLLWRLHPQATVLAWPRQRIISFGFGPKKMSQHHAYLAIQSAHVNLGFYRGASLPDPTGLLEGTGQNLRHIKLTSPDALQQPAVRALVQAAMDERRGR